MMRWAPLTWSGSDPTLGDSELSRHGQHSDQRPPRRENHVMPSCPHPLHSPHGDFRYRLTGTQKGPVDIECYQAYCGVLHGFMQHANDTRKTAKNMRCQNSANENIPLETITR